MILFKLKCASGHEFEGWFRDNAAYDRQHGRGLITCPECGGVKVEKALMAPRLGRSRGDVRAESAREEKQAEPAAQAPAKPDEAKAAPSPAEIRRALRELRRQVETNCDYVGSRFAEEARRRHRGEGDTEGRGIYGEATPAEGRALSEEGIEIASIPWIPPNDA